MGVIRASLFVAAAGILLTDGARITKRRSVDGSGDCPPVRTQPNFDLSAYIKKPWFAQQQAVRPDVPADGMNCVVAQYSLKEKPTVLGWTITVDNRGRYDNGTNYGGEICAYVPDESNSAKIQVAPCFLPKFISGPYWVLAYDEAEGYALVSGGQPTIVTDDGCKGGTGNNDGGLWIFTRDVFPAAGLVEKVRGIAKSQGFDLSVLENVNHEGCPYGSGERMVLAESVTETSKSMSDSNACAPVRTQPNLDLNSYIKKRWYVQQQMVTQYLPADGMNCATAQYTLKENPTFWGWTITVDNRAVYDNGTAFGGEICAKVPDSSDSARLKVAPCFLPSWFGGPYWVVAYDEQEGYALIIGGQPTVETDNGCRLPTGGDYDAGMWIFTRAPIPAAGLVEKVRGIATSQGFDLSVLVDVARF